MPGIAVKFTDGPQTFPVSGTVLGGQVVELDGTAKKVKTGTAGSTKVVGVAKFDAVETDASTGTTSYGASFADTSFPQGDVAVITFGVVKLKFAANAGAGVVVKAAATGQVTPWVSGTDAADLIIGRVVDVNGATSGGYALVRLLLG